MRYYLIAGEASGDLHGSNLMKGLYEKDKEACIRFWGGDCMLSTYREREGGGLVRNYKDGAVMGFAEVFASLGKLLRNLSSCKEDILAFRPDVVILIDYPGFNMRIARFCHSKGIRVFYYIAPKTWASREWRNRNLKRWVDMLFIVFPFEIPYFESRGIPFVYKGNPLIDAVDSYKFQPLGTGKSIAVLAGSRKGEISRMMPVCMQVADILHADERFRDYRFVVAGAPARTEDDYLQYIGGRDWVDLVFGRTYDVLKSSRSAIINSGTASLESVLIGTPQVVCWSTGRLTAFIGRHILRVLDRIKFISLGNLCVDSLVFKEFIQEDFNVRNVCDELERLCFDEDYRARMLSSYEKIRLSLGGSGASVAVAASMIETLKTLIK